MPAWWLCCQCLKKDQLVSSVKCLDFSHHHLVDVPPDVFQYERTLEELHLNANRICELPRQLFYCQELRVLYLNDNEIASIPPAINSLINLNKLDLSRNMFSSINDNMKALKNLRFLDLSMNGLEKVPEPVMNLISLHELYLNDTMMDFLPANFGRLINLRILELRENLLVTLPKSMARLSNLQRIDIGQNDFTELPEVVGQLTNLVELWLDNNKIRRLPPNIGNLQQLQHVDMNNNLLTSLSPDIGQWARVEELSCSGNELESIPATIGQLKCLVSLKLDENQLQELPESICQCEMLEELMLSHNDLFQLPNTIGLLRRLRILTVDENFLRVLPDELSRCTALTILSVRGNKLTELPPDIGHLANLRVINIVNNFVTDLPVSLLNLTNLAALWINDNQSQPLVPLQKEYAPNGNIHLTCYMLPQTANGSLSGQQMTPARQNKNTTEKRRICFASEVTQNGNSADEDEDRVEEDGSNERQDLISEQNEIVSGGSGESPAIQSPDPTVRLMRSPTPYPKDLRMLAKYVRHGPNAAANRSSRSNSVNLEEIMAASPTATPSKLLDGSADEFDGDRRLRPESMPAIAGQSHNYNPYEVIRSGVQQDQLLQMPSTTQMPMLSQIREATRVTASSITGGGVPAPGPQPVVGDADQCIAKREQHQHHQPLTIVRPNYVGYLNSNNINNNNNNNNIDINNRDHELNNNPLPQQQHTYKQDDDFTNNNFKNRLPNHIDTSTLITKAQPPPYHIAKTYTKKSPEDLMIYDSFRNSQHKQLSSRDSAAINGQRAVSVTPTPIMRQPTPINEGEQLLTTTRLLPPSQRPLLAVPDDAANGYDENSNMSTNDSRTAMSPPPFDDVDSISILSKDNQSPVLSTAATSPSKADSSGGGSPLKKADSSPSWLFGLHRNPRVLQYQIHHSNNNISDQNNGAGFTITQLENEAGIYVNDVDKQSIANLYLRKMDKILDIDGTDFTKMSLIEAQRFIDENILCQNSAFNVMISRK